MAAAVVGLVWTARLLDSPCLLDRLVIAPVVPRLSFPRHSVVDAAPVTNVPACMAVASNPSLLGVGVVVPRLGRSPFPGTGVAAQMVVAEWDTEGFVLVLERMAAGFVLEPGACVQWLGITMRGSQQVDFSGAGGCSRASSHKTRSPARPVRPAGLRTCVAANRDTDHHKRDPAAILVRRRYERPSGVVTELACDGETVGTKRGRWRGHPTPPVQLLSDALAG
mmetsp:Transcript_89828/g.205313  ORF Transcript_89828/g.205313 Transcript_89828/m.205313 type:complete len:223 (-) Transcript_89828:442-1110(-)